MPSSHIARSLHTLANSLHDPRPIEGELEDFSQEVREFSGAESEQRVAPFAAGLPRYEIRRKSIFPEITDAPVSLLHTAVRATAQLRPLRTNAALRALGGGE